MDNGDQLLKTIGEAYREYMKGPVKYSWAFVLSLLLNVVFLGAALGAFMIIYCLLSLVGLGSITLIVAIILGVLFILYLILVNGLKGALIKTYKNLTTGDRPHITFYVQYALKRGETFFLITLIKTIIQIIPLAIIGILYTYVLADYDFEFMFHVLGVVIAFILFVIEIPFVFAYVSAAVDGSGVIGALKSSLRLWRNKFVSAFALYFVYALVWATLFIPLLDILSLLVFYPIMCTALILFYDKHKA